MRFSVVGAQTDHDEWELMTNCCHKDTRGVVRCSAAAKLLVVVLVIAAFYALWCMHALCRLRPIPLRYPASEHAREPVR